MVVRIHALDYSCTTYNDIVIVLKIASFKKLDGVMVGFSKKTPYTTYPLFPFPFFCSAEQKTITTAMVGSGAERRGEAKRRRETRHVRALSGVCTA